MPLALACAAEEPAVAESAFRAAVERHEELAALCARAKAAWVEAALTGQARGAWSRLAWILERSPAYREWFARHAEGPVSAPVAVGLALTPAQFSDLERLARAAFVKSADANRPQPKGSK